MMNGLSQGEKPDYRQLDHLLVQQQNLVNAGSLLRKRRELK